MRELRREDLSPLREKYRLCQQIEAPFTWLDVWTSLRPCQLRKPRMASNASLLVAAPRPRPRPLAPLPGLAARPVAEVGPPVVVKAACASGACGSVASAASASSGWPIPHAVLIITMVILFGMLFLVGINYFLGASASQWDRLHECDRQCRYASAEPLKRAITGELKSVGLCECTGPGSTPTVPTYTPRECPGDAWCGDFSTDAVCVLGPAGKPPATTTRAAAEAAGQTVLHCGACGACSTLHDLQVLQRTRNVATERLSSCASAYAKPAALGGHASVERLRQCLVDQGLDFSTDGAAWRDPSGMPTCMDCWVDDIGCASTQCVDEPDCLAKFTNPSNDAAHTGCIKCDEERCGVPFIRCAGANRRSTGLSSVRPTPRPPAYTLCPLPPLALAPRPSLANPSDPQDIERPKGEICPVGYYASKPRAAGRWNESSGHRAAAALAAAPATATRSGREVVFGASLHDGVWPDD